MSSDPEEVSVNALWQYSRQRYCYFVRTADGRCGAEWQSDQQPSAIRFIGGPDDGKVIWFAEQ